MSGCQNGGGGVKVTPKKHTGKLSQQAESPAEEKTTAVVDLSPLPRHVRLKDPMLSIRAMEAKAKKILHQRVEDQIMTPSTKAMRIA